jgi:lipid-A-disaccharide synthase
MPGSRRNELRQLLPLHLAAARALHARRPDVRFALGLAHTLDADETLAALEAEWPGAPVRVIAGGSRELLLASDAALAKPGTVTLEAALLGCPLVVTGRAHPLTAALWRRLSRVPTFALPNLLSGRTLVPELLQRDAEPSRIADALLSLLDGAARERQLAGFEEVRKRLGDDVAAARAAEIAEAMLAERAS